VIRSKFYEGFVYSLNMYLFADYNGTLIQNPTEGELWKSVVEKSIWYKALHGRLPTAYAMTKAGFEMKSLIADYKAGKIGYSEVYKVLNEEVLSHVPVHVVEEFIKAYARNPETQARLDERMLRPMAYAQVDIVSTASRFGIRETIGARNARVQPCNLVWVRIVKANDIFPKGAAGSCFDLSIYNSWDKREALRRISPSDMRNSAFFGDSKDDKKCMELTKERGGTVVAPFFATDAFKQEIAREYDARVPETEEDLKKILKELIWGM
jgi:hypothetical protein